MPLEKFSEKRRQKDEERETEKGRELGKQKELVLCKPGHTKLGEKEITGFQRVTEQYLQAPILWHKNACYLKLSHLCAVEQNPLGYFGTVASVLLMCSHRIIPTYASPGVLPASHISH